MTAFFTIITAMWNRQSTIERCIRSCIDQSFTDFEMIIVDDASTDNSAHVVQLLAKDDFRIKLIRLPFNVGMHFARQTGILNSEGKWIITLDSDDSLLPGGLESIYERCVSASEEIGVIGSSYKHDTGEISPPKTPCGVINYNQYIKWLNSEDSGDWLTCHRREVFTTCSWPRSFRGGLLFHLDVAKKWEIQISNDVCGRVYSDAGNQNSKIGNLSLKISRLTKWSGVEIECIQKLLLMHGRALKTLGPKVYDGSLLAASLSSYSSGRRWLGTKYTIIYLLRHPFSVRLYISLIIGLISKRLFVYLRALGHVQKSKR